MKQRALGRQLFDIGDYRAGSWHLVAAELNRLRSRQLIVTPAPPPPTP